MAELHMLPNVEYLHTIEDDIYQYAVDYPGEYLDTNMEDGLTEFSGKWVYYIEKRDIIKRLVIIKIKFAK